MTRTVDSGEVIDGLRAIVAVFGEDHTYRSPGADNCVYQYEGGPSCLIGQLLVKHLAIPSVALIELDLLGNPGIAGREALDWLATCYDIAFTPEAVRVMSVAQAEQDAGSSWGEALDVAASL